MASIVPQELNWTKARAECSAVALFKQLQLGVENDIASLHSKPYPGLDEGFASALTKDGSTLIVAHRSNKGPRVVFFVAASSIEIRDEASGKRYVAVVILNDEGRCKLQIEGKELELWQVRRMALEALFFGDTISPHRNAQDQP